MNPPQTNWLPGLLVLATGVVAALVFLFTSKRTPETKPAADAPGEGDASAPAVPSPSDDLAAKYQQKLGELKEHIANRHLLSADVWEKEKLRLEQAAAAALRERDGVRHEAAKKEARLEKKAQAEAKATGFFARNPAVGGALIGGLVVAFFAYLGMSVSNPENARTDGPPGMGGAAMGGPQMGGPMQPQTDPKLEALAAQVQANPDDVEAVTGLALRLISLQSFEEARPLLARAAMLDPYQVRGRVGRAVLKAVDGDVAGAQRELERLGASYPEAYDGHLYAGLLALEQNDERRAVHQLELYVNTAPASEQPPMIRMEVERMKAELAGAPAAP